MAHVYLAVMRGDRGFNKLVVLKVANDVISGDPDMLGMFMDEARLAARLSHPNVVQTYEVVREAERDIIVMEYLDGYTLSELLAQARNKRTALPRWMHLQILIHATSGLHYAHEAKDFDGKPLKLVHRDVSPHNVFVTFDGQVKVLDFGIAKAATSTHQTDVGTIKGKIRYMSPEQLINVDVDRRADIFALGAVLWEAAVGERLWHDKTDPEVMHAVSRGDIPMPRDVKPDAPIELDVICRKAMAFMKDSRYATCLELQKDLEAYVESLPDTGSMREVSSFMETLFVEARAERQAIIEKQLARLDVPSSPDLVGAYTPSAGASLPVITRVKSGTGPSLQSALSAELVTRSEKVEMDRPRSPARRVGVAAATLLTVAGVAVAATRSVDWLRAPPALSNAPAVPPPTSTPIVAAPPVAPAPAKAVVVVSAQPSNAKLFLDGAPLDKNPAVLSLPRDGATLVVRAEASGYVPREVPIVVDQDREVSLTLDKGKVTVTRGAQGHSTPRVSASSDAKPANTGYGYLSLDTYPWTRVSEGDRVLGQTPLVRARLSEGEHTLVLDNPEQNIRQTTVVSIKKDETTVRRLGLK